MGRDCLRALEYPEPTSLTITVEIDGLSLRRR
ncbi:hypothetical protein SAMN06264364_12942 [Quadrisphaera granulorum]|uniref:Uncharacterized protein n=1 Tax=Quadrisphaera granulorum TaxID=317664 RepID=A0A315ZSY1_9ACTN|nr:hypothetical protein BXY45_12942 [Quadrisphaera granulorum]SZE98383.1 hypothetical protein SAMN06264364_12942 [Quadrisphaera granulorum]